MVAPVVGDDVPPPPVGPVLVGLDGSGLVGGADVGAVGEPVVGCAGGGTTLPEGAVPDSDGLGAGGCGAGDAEGVTDGGTGLRRRSGGVEWC
ncbi:hypothetical protein ACOKM5_39465 [Streptomyces sp. BH097]|uniref:hypothetical protein n=1 Tax=unclassified Streptomyces TaxID=2593676 RepID=UPI003BB6F571